MGGAPLAVTARYNKTCVLSINPLDCKKLSRYPFCKNTRSSRRDGGHSSTILSRTSLRVAMYIGPVPLGSIDVDIGSDRVSSLAFCEIRSPIRPPPITYASSEEGGVAESLVLAGICIDDGSEGEEKASASV